MKFPKYSLLAALLLASLPAMAQTEDPLDALDVSYIYAAVMGSGTYKINDLRISMLRVPFSYTQQDLTLEQPGIRWDLPVVFGYDALQYEDWVNRFLEDELVTLTIMPGFEVMQHLTEAWVFKPFGNLGMSYDFTRDEPVLMGVLGIRMLGTWEYADASEFRMGTSMRYAAEYQIESDRGLGFSMWEVGFDYRRDTHIRVISRDTNAGVYWRSQLFLPEWTLQKFRRGEDTSVALINEIGVSVGLRHPFKKWGLSASRVRTGFQFGDNIRGWTFGTDFPF
ncbi:hypothetical protein P4C99_04920 [Pontiellaceae bacterium B1224]|nr:hypothetical protein [Pontiellaceae bacterium B1224]